MKEITVSFFKITTSSIIMGVVAKMSYEYLILFFSQNIALFLGIIIGAILYMTIMYFMKIDDIDEVVAMVKNKISGRQKI